MAFLPALEILLDHAPEGRSRFRVMDVLHILFYLFTFLCIEGNRRGGLFRLTFLHRNDLTKLERDFLNSVLPEVPVHFLDDLWLEQRELLHPGRAVHGQKKFLAAYGLRLGMARDRGADGLLPLPEDAVSTRANCLSGRGVSSSGV